MNPVKVRMKNPALIEYLTNRSRFNIGLDEITVLKKYSRYLIGIHSQMGKIEYQIGYLHLSKP
jgi:hypothetical protein